MTKVVHFHDQDTIHCFNLEPWMDYQYLDRSIGPGQYFISTEASSVKAIAQALAEGFQYISREEARQKTGWARIYRDYSCNLSKEWCADLLRSPALVKGQITSCFSTATGIEDFRSLGRCTMHFRLEFPNQHSLDRFHELGFVTTEPPKIHLN